MKVSTIPQMIGIEISKIHRQIFRIGVKFLSQGHGKVIAQIPKWLAVALIKDCEQPLFSEPSQAVQNYFSSNN